MKRLAVLCGVTAALLSAAPAQAAGAQQTSSAVYLFSNGSIVPNAQASLVTSSAGASMSLLTSGLVPGDAVTVWWVVFNYPNNCAGPSAGHPFQCGPSDLGNPAVSASILFATGHVIDGSGAGDYGAHLAVGDTSGALFGPGLLAPLTAHVHLVVRDHGAALPDILSEQIHSFGVCNVACTNVQFAVFEQ
jgi:hypothetical protein